uniref:Reverse transcriptase domain-containing protein n=1 Tax=Cannabis sativa TaxID=3483 RepID=A0A803QD09_CANSA
MIPKPVQVLGKGAAIILGGVVTLNLVSSATVGALRAANEAKRKSVAEPCRVCRGKGFYICKLCKGNSTIEWSPLHDPVAINPCLCPTCDGNRKKKVGRKPVTRLTIDDAVVGFEGEKEGSDDLHSMEGLELIAEIVEAPDLIETEEANRSGKNRTQSWAEEVDNEKTSSDVHHSPESAKRTCETFMKEKVSNRDQRLLFTEPLIRDGIKIAKVSKLSMGLIMVRFNDEATRDQVVEAGVVQFDQKPVIVRPWSADLNAMNLVRTVPLGIRLHDQGLQYWGTKSLIALVSTIGKPIMVDQHTKDRTRLQYARILKEKKGMKEIAASNVQHQQEWEIPKKTKVLSTTQPSLSRENAESSSNSFTMLQEQKEDGVASQGGNMVTLNDIRDATTWLAQSHMEKLLKTGSGFTWTNNQDGDKRIYSRIDHTLVNEDGTDNFPSAKAHYSWETISDHCLCVISMASNEKIGHKPFRYYNFRAKHPKFKDVVVENWHRPMKREGMTTLYLKLMRLKHTIKRINKERIGDVGKKNHGAKEYYRETRLQAQEHIHDMSYQLAEKEDAMEFNAQEKMYHSFLRQRSKSLRSDCMELGNRLNLEHQLSLIKPFTSKEIKKAFFSIPDSKSPRPDGYGASFFKTMWPELGAEFIKAVENFFKTGFMPREFHATMITLIPKTETPTKAVDFRPIAHCLTVYKCISKLLCSRLSQVLLGLINQNQGAFVQGRSIAHNVMILQDLLKNYKRKNISPRCTLKVDISKAYDTSVREFQRHEGIKTGRSVNSSLVCHDNGVFDQEIIASSQPIQDQESKEVLDEFSATSGLTINTNKSHLYFVGK